MKKFTVRENSTLKKFTDATYPQGSFALNVLLKKGDIRVNGVKVRADCPVTAGEEVVYYTTPAQEGKRSHTVVYEDENILVCDKESGVSSEALFCEIEESGARFPVHRLDRNTVGLIAVAKSEEAQNILIDAFKNRAVDKVYFCLAKNNFKRTAATLTAYLSKDAVQGTVKISDAPSDGAVRIITEYEVIETSNDLALVKIILHTGKTHQIRAHLAFIGCPVLGDGKYGDFALNRKYRVTRQLLVAKELTFHLNGKWEYLNGLKFVSRRSISLTGEIN